MEKPTPKYKVKDKVLYMAEIDGKKTQVVAEVKNTLFSPPHWAWGYCIEYPATFGWETENVLEMYLTPLHEKPVKSIEELLSEVATQINTDNPGYICEITKCDAPYVDESLSVVFKCMVTHPHLCEKRVIALHDAEDGAETLPNFICTKFSEFKQTCEAQRRMEQAKVDYTKFFNNNPKIYGKEVDLSVFARPRGNGKTELQKMLLNAGIYAADSDIYKGGFVYPEPDKPNKDFWDAACYAFAKPYTNAIVKIIKEESEMNVTKVNKKQEAELTEYYQNVPWPYRPKKIIFNGPATIVIWADDTKTVVKCSGNEEYDRKLAFKYAMHKRYVELHNNKYNYLRQFTKALERTNDPQAAFVEVFSTMEMNFATNGKSDGYFKAIEKHFKKEFES